MKWHTSWTFRWFGCFVTLYVQSFLETEVLHSNTLFIIQFIFYCKVFLAESFQLTPFERWQGKWFISVEEFLDLWFWNNVKLILDDGFSLGVDGCLHPWTRRLLNPHPEKFPSPKRADLSVCQVSICLMSL